jgi:hypothetical protein
MPPDPVTLTGELMAITRAAQKSSAGARLMLLRKRGLYRAYRQTFFDDQGHMFPWARTVIDDLADKSGIGMAAAGLEHEELACREGERRLFLHLIGRFQLNETEIFNLERDIAKENHDGRS